MVTHTRRYVFLEFDTLLRTKFKKLEKVCDKIFIFVGSNTTDISFALVKEMQRMGNSVKWVEVGTSLTQDLNYHICFLMGKLHEKISGDVEFAILSNDTAFDPLVDFINSTGRSCVRIKINTADMPPPPKADTKPPITQNIQTASTEAPKTEAPKAEGPYKAEVQTKQETHNHLFGERISESDDDDDMAHANGEYTLIEETAKETVRRLIRSGNRPKDLLMLRNYILLHNQELSLHGDVDKIISRLRDSKEIEFSNDAVRYNF